MALYLVQHGKALSKRENPDRPLTEEGINEVKEVAEQLAAKKIQLDRIIHSGKSRAVDTAKILRRALDSKIPLVLHENLNPTDPINHFIDELDDSENIMVVGHLPYLSKLISHLIIGDENKTVVNVHNGGIIALEKSEDRWGVEWIITP